MPQLGLNKIFGHWKKGFNHLDCHFALPVRVRSPLPAQQKIEWVGRKRGTSHGFSYGWDSSATPRPIHKRTPITRSGKITQIRMMRAIYWAFYNGFFL